MKKCKNKSNISIVKDYLEGNRPCVQFGYTPLNKPNRENGEVWIDNDGIEKIKIGPTTISKKLYDTVELTRQICPSCKKDIRWSGNRYDEVFFNKTGKCYDCVIDEETQLRIEGKYELYEKLKIIKNQKSFLEDMKQKIDGSIKWINEQNNKIKYVNEDGSIEEWDDVSTGKFLESMEKDLKETNEALVRCNTSIDKLEKEYGETEKR